MSKILDTYNFRMPSFGIGREISLMAVLSEDGMGEYAVYIGIVPANQPEAERQNFAECICQSGQKQSFTDAQQYFSGLEESKYRR